MISISIVSFDVVILSDLVNDLWDVQTVLERVGRLSHPRTRIIVNWHSHLWGGPLATAKALHLSRPMPSPQNWLTVPDLTNLMNLTNFDVVKGWPEIIWPVRTPFVDEFCNRVLARLWPIKHLSLSNFIVARPGSVARRSKASVSVIVAARNEAGNVPEIFSRLPKMGYHTELIFCGS